MKIAIVAAMSEEVAVLKTLITNQDVKKIMHVEFTSGQLEGKEVVLMESGIGKVNVAIGMALLFQNFEIGHVINTGSAGGLLSTAAIGDIVLGTEVAYHDVDVTGFGYEMGQVPKLPATFKADESLAKKAIQVLEAKGMPYHEGQIVTGDVFMNDEARVAFVHTHFPDATSCEMEAAAVAHVCHQANVPFIILRSLSDIVGKEATISFQDYLPLAVKHSSEIVRELILNL